MDRTPGLWTPENSPESGVPVPRSTTNFATLQMPLNFLEDFVSGTPDSKYSPSDKQANRSGAGSGVWTLQFGVGRLVARYSGWREGLRERDS